jgi:hypothetical protein
MHLEDIPALLSDLVAAQRDTAKAVQRLTEVISTTSTAAPVQVEASPVRQTGKKSKPASTAPGSSENGAATMAQPNAPAAGEAEKPAQVSSDLAKNVTDAIVQLAKVKGRAKAVEVLNRFGVNAVPSLPADQYPAVLQAATDALEAA